VLGTAVFQAEITLTSWSLITFGLTLAAALLILYAILLAAASLVFWYPGFMIGWVFDAVFQMARYPVGVYPGWLRLLLTWIVPVGVITTVPAAALTDGMQPGWLLATLLLAAVLVTGASLLFRSGLRRYASASS
jgi:ABC-2 type transport system permease protein